jgi:hypothetical protein
MVLPSDCEIYPSKFRGAERLIGHHPERIFLDTKATRPLPLKLPPRETMGIHGIVVVRGAGDACKRHFKGGNGSLLMRPEFRGDHTEDRKMIPFAVGDADPGGPFVHIFDDASQAHSWHCVVRENSRPSRLPKWNVDHGNDAPR